MLANLRLVLAFGFNCERNLTELCVHCLQWTAGRPTRRQFSSLTIYKQAWLLTVTCLRTLAPWKTRHFRGGLLTWDKNTALRVSPSRCPMSIATHVIIACNLALFDPLSKLADRAIYFTLRNFFFFTMSKAISVSTGPIFTIFSLNGRYLREFS